MHTCVHVCTPRHMQRPEEDIRCSVLSLSTLVPLRQGLSLNFELGWCHQAPMTSYLYLAALEFQGCAAVPSSFTWVLGFELGSSCLSTEPSPSPAKRKLSAELTNLNFPNTISVCGAGGGRWG